MHISVYSLAPQCPYAAGDAVYIARTLYNLIDHNAYFDDEEICVATATYKKEQAKKNKVQNFTVSISPNPASNIVDITIKGSREDLLLIVYNILGEVMGTTTVNGYIELNVGDFPNGLYQIKCVNSQGIEFQTRLVVTK